jgi:hypothetical protein
MKGLGRRALDRGERLSWCVWLRSDRDERDEVIEPPEVVTVASVEGELESAGGGGDEEIDGPGTALLAPADDDRGSGAR